MALAVNGVELAFLCESFRCYPARPSQAELLNHRAAAAVRVDPVAPRRPRNPVIIINTSSQRGATDRKEWGQWLTRPACYLVNCTEEIRQQSGGFKKGRLTGSFQSRLAFGERRRLHKGLRRTFDRADCQHRARGGEGGAVVPEQAALLHFVNFVSFSAQIMFTRPE